MVKRTRPSSQLSSLQERVKQSCNSNIAGYLYELYENSAARNDKLQFVYKKALNSVLELTEPIICLKDLEKLQGIGPKIRSRLEKCYVEDGGKLPSVADPSNDPVPLSQRDSNIFKDTTSKRRRKIQKEYVPAFKSGPYAMLIALHLEALNPDSKGYLLKKEIIEIGQPYCNNPLDEGLISPIQGAIKTLLSKGLVEKWSIPARFSLTDPGSELAGKLWNSGERRSSAPIPDPPSPDKSNAEKDSDMMPSQLDTGQNDLSGPVFETFCLERDAFEVVLLVDVRETKSREERDFITDKLNCSGIICEQRNLELGDFIWVARAKSGISAPDEILLDTIVERKREDDLVASIPDGRFMEQKFRLRNSGITNLIYLVEKAENVDFKNIGQDRFNAAIIQTQVVDGLYLRYTNNLEESLRFLIATSNYLTNQTKNLSLHAGIMQFPVKRDQYFSFLRSQSILPDIPYYQSFGCFTQLNSKSLNLTFSDVFMKQLMTIKHLSADKASVIVQKFPTAISLWRHYRSLQLDRDKEGYFKDWYIKDSQRRFGLILSRRIYKVFMSEYINDSI